MTVITPVSLRALEQMRARGGSWFGYCNADLSSSMCGDLQFLQCGEGCTYAKPPRSMPDTAHAIGWKYIFVEKVNLVEGTIEEVNP